MSVLVGNGGGTVQAPQTYAVGVAAWDVTAADFDGDGKPDLAVANVNSDDVSVLPGNGDGTFRPARNHSTGDGSYAVAVGAFNGDGRPDLAMASWDRRRR